MSARQRFHPSVRRLALLAVAGLGAALRLEAQTPGAPPPVAPPPAPVAAAPAPPPEQRLLFLFQDDKALRVGDVVTVLVVQSASATSSAQRQTNRKESDSRAGVSGLLSVPTASQMQSNSQLAAGSQEQRGMSLLATLATRVVEVLPNGNLKIEGMQEYEIEGRKQGIKVSGIIRPQDVRTNNTISSTAIADARIEFRGNWLARPPRRNNTLGNVLNVLKAPFYFFLF